MGIAWWVWHDKDFFEKMRTDLGCPLLLGTAESTIDERHNWFEWLVGMDSGGEKYNLHALWLWYCKEVPGVFGTQA